MKLGRRCNYLQGQVAWHSVINVKAQVDAFNQEKALIGAVFMIVKSSRTFVSLKLY